LCEKRNNFVSKKSNEKQKQSTSGKERKICKSKNKATWSNLHIPAMSCMQKNFVSKEQNKKQQQIHHRANAY